MTPLDPRYVPLQREAGWYATAALSVGALVGSIVLFGPRRWYLALPLWAAATAAFAFWSYRWAEIQYRHTAYEVDDEGLEIHRGVYWREIANVPRSRVQHTDVAQGPLERKYGLGRLIVYTAGTSHSRVELAGLEHGVALTLRNHLLPRQTADGV